jgi:hypothetical protein
VKMTNRVRHKRLLDPRARGRVAKPATKGNRSGSATISAACLGALGWVGLLAPDFQAVCLTLAGA